MVIPLFLVCYKKCCASIFVALIVVFTIFFKHLFTQKKSLFPRFTSGIYVNKLGDAQFCSTSRRSSGQRQPQLESLVAPKAEKSQQWFPHEFSSEIKTEKL